MSPILKDGDVLLFNDDTSGLSIGEIVLFKDPVNSEFVVHRVISLMPFETKGDWSCQKEEIPKDNVFGRVHGFKRGDLSYLISSPPFLTNIYLFLSKQLLEKCRVRRRISRLGLLFLSNFMTKRDDL